MKRMLQAEQWRGHSFAGALQSDDGFLLALAREDEQVAGPGTLQ